MESTPILPGLENLVAPFRFPAAPHEFKVMPLRECPTPDSLTLCETPNVAADYWRMHIPSNPYFNPEVECLVVLLLNTRTRIKGHQIVSLGTQDSLLISPREVYRLAVLTAANRIILMHNHPSGESTPSYADIIATRDLANAGRVLKIELIDHVIVGAGNFSSLRALGHFEG